MGRSPLGYREAPSVIRRVLTGGRGRRHENTSWNDTAKSQGTRAARGSWERKGNGCSPWARLLQARQQPCPHLDFRPGRLPSISTPRTAHIRHFALSQEVCGDLLQQQQETNTDLEWKENARMVGKQDILCPNNKGVALNFLRPDFYWRRGKFLSHVSHFFFSGHFHSYASHLIQWQRSLHFNPDFHGNPSSIPS